MHGRFHVVTTVGNYTRDDAGDSIASGHTSPLGIMALYNVVVEQHCDTQCHPEVNWCQVWCGIRDRMYFHQCIRCSDSRRRCTPPVYIN